MPEKHLIKPHISLLGASLIFGANYWIAKGLMPVFMTPLQIIFLRVAVSTPLFWIVSYFFPYEKVKKIDLLRIAWCSLLGVVINQVMFFEGLRLSKPVETSILYTTNPIVVLIFAAFIIGERIRLSRLAGIILGATGALMIVMKDQAFSFQPQSLLGNSFILISIISYSLYLVLMKPVMQHYSPLTVMKWAFLFGFIAVVPFTAPSMARMNWAGLTNYAWFSITYVAVITTFLAYLLIIFSLKKLSPSVVGFYTYLQPLIAAVMGSILYKDKITPMKVISAILIFSGVYLVSRKPRMISEQMTERDQ